MNDAFQRFQSSFESDCRISDVETCELDSFMPVTGRNFNTSLFRKPLDGL